MLPSQRRRQEKSLQLYLLLCDFYLVKEALAGRMEGIYKLQGQFCFYKDLVARCHSFVKFLYLYLYTFNSITFTQNNHPSPFSSLVSSVGKTLLNYNESRFELVPALQQADALQLSCAATTLVSNGKLLLEQFNYQCTCCLYGAGRNDFVAGKSI